MLLLISGCSGVGKNTIINELLKTQPNLKFLKNYTTRIKRNIEQDERLSPYHYVTLEEFDQKIKNGEFYEYEEIHGNFYGTLKASIEEISQSDCDYIKDIGVLGKLSLEKAFDGKDEVVSIFLTAPREVLIERLKGRGEPDIEKRLSRMDFEMGHIDNYDYVIENINMQKTIKKILKIMKVHSKKK